MTPVAAPRIDWAAVTMLLADRAAAPMVLLDRTGRVSMCNHAMEELLERPRLELVGRSFVDELVPKEGRELIASRFAEALQGTTKQCDCPVRVSGGVDATLTFEVAAVGHGGAAGLLASVVRVRRPTNVVDHQGIVDLRYSISTAAHDFGRVLRVRSADGAIASEHLVGAYCYRAIHRRDRPCDGCPALVADGNERRTSVVVSGWDDAPFAVVTAEPARDGAREIAAHFVGPSVTSGLMRARLHALAESGGLSEREREVLNLLVLGRTYGEIGRVLQIGERTVKYHQTNILEKLGADSRVDLLRLFF